MRSSWRHFPQSLVHHEAAEQGSSATRDPLGLLPAIDLPGFAWWCSTHPPPQPDEDGEDESPRIQYPLLPVCPRRCTKAPPQPKSLPSHGKSMVQFL
jgi:hypothetical protein